MKIKTFSSFGVAHNFESFKWDAAFRGVGIDVRCNEAISLLERLSTTITEVEYSVTQPHRIRCGDNLISPKGLVDALAGHTNIALEATSLGTVEILQLLRAAKQAKIKCVDCLYVEPRDYEKSTYLESSWSRDFSLSNSHRITSVPGFLATRGDTEGHQVRLVAFLGYESSRLAAAAEQEVGLNWDKYAIVGVPGFSPGWEANTLANNIDELEAQDFQSVRYCSASSVTGALDLLEQIHSEGHRDTPHTAIAPMGTKPHGIATALFLLRHSQFQESSLIYDHPLRTTGRTSEIRRWHLYRIDLSD